MTEWNPVQPRGPRCYHTWQTVKVEERPGFKKFTQRCPQCGYERVLDRRVLPKLPREPMRVRPPKSNCHHIWMSLDQQASEDGTLMKYRHECPKCGRLKTTVRRQLPPRQEAIKLVSAMLDS